VSHEIGDADLRRLVLEVLSSSSTDDWGSLANEVTHRLKDSQLGILGRRGEHRVHEAMIGLFIEQLITISGRYTPRSWPSIQLTGLGKEWARLSTLSRDPDGYASVLREHSPGVEQATIEYAVEAFKCLQQNLLFACAVMIGAAAEREIFRLGRVIAESATGARKLQEALDRGRLPALFQEIRKAVEEVSKTGAMPYAVHQGAVDHLLSFQEMIRVQRNDAVHSGAEGITKSKVLLSIQTFPTALGVIERLRFWYEERNRSQTGQ
jgi:hypothetical protein